MQGGGGGRGQHLGTGGVAGDDPQWRRGLAAEWLEMELTELLSGCTWVKGEGCGDGVVQGRGLGGAFIGRGGRARVGHGGGLRLPRAARVVGGRARSATGRAREARARRLGL